MSQPAIGAAAMAQSKWDTLFEGSGSASGNDWLEEVCYLGEEQWLLSLRDDPAWSGGDIDVQEPEEHTSATLAAWVIDMDCTDGDDDQPRVLALLEIAAAEGAKECEALLRAHLAHGSDEDEDTGGHRSSQAKAWAEVASRRSRASRPPGGGGGNVD